MLVEELGMRGMEVEAWVEVWGMEVEAWGIWVEVWGIWVGVREG
jgi:hypothetical protein